MRFDSHVHSYFSMDAADSMSDVVQAATFMGLDGLCFTDHCDLMNSEFPDRASDNCYEAWAESAREIEAVRARWGDKIEILHGMELGEITLAPERAKQCAAHPGLDFLLGSVHMVAGHQDFYFLKYPSMDFCAALADQYLDTNIRMAELDLADVIAHIGYLNRYTERDGFRLDFMDYEEKLRHLFGILIQNGRGIEVNTSALRRRRGAARMIPDLPELKLYRECGGEIVTLGSDAHSAMHVGSHLREAEELLRTAGFRYTTVFRQRKPDFIKL